MTKIEALKKTVYNLENDIYNYSWGNCNSCNCGILAKTIMDGKEPTKSGLFSLGIGAGFSGTYGDGVEDCLKTGIPMPLVIKDLYECGFTYEELDGLEVFRDKKIVDRAKLLDGGDYTIKDDVIKYLKAWVEILEEQEGKTPIPEKPKEKTKTVYVTITETLKSPVPETQLN